jgi:Putative peptidoglycan-binding domain-containing protein
MKLSEGDDKWSFVSSKLGDVTSKARSLALEVCVAAWNAGHDVWFVWGDGNEMDHMLNHTQDKPVLDFMVHNEAAGDWVRDYIWANRSRHGLKHVIWEQHITSTVVSPGVRRKMSDRGDPTANHFDHVHTEWFAGDYVPADQSPPVSTHLTVDGELGPKTIKQWQKVMGTKVDGVITPRNSDLVRAVQRRLKATVNSRLTVDGDGIYQNGRFYNTVAALQTYLGSPTDGRLSVPKSEAVKALQRRLNENRF